MMLNFLSRNFNSFKSFVILAILLFAALNFTYGQCDLNRHNTSWNDAWTSCITRTNPNTIHGDGHWILYNFGSDYELLESHIWNLNDPENLKSGIDEISIDYSLDGVNWSTWGNFNIPIADGKSVYSGTSGPDLTGIIAQYILITAISNHGGKCYGFSEIKFEINEDYIASIDTKQKEYCFKASLNPNPTVGNSILKIESNCDEKFSLRILDAIGQEVQKKIIIDQGQDLYHINSSKYNPGVYFVEINRNGKKKSLKLIKLK